MAYLLPFPPLDDRAVRRCARKLPSIVWVKKSAVELYRYGKEVGRGNVYVGANRTDVRTRKPGASRTDVRTRKPGASRTDVRTRKPGSRY